MGLSFFEPTGFLGMTKMGKNNLLFTVMLAYG